MKLAPKLIVLGNVNLDLGLGPVPAWPQPGTEVIGERAVYRPGGSAGNAAMAAAAAGMDVELRADVGDDAAGEWLLTALQKAGVDCTRVERRAAKTAFSFGALHPDGERTFFSFLGHLASQRVGDAAEICSAPEGSVVLACGYFLLPRWRDGALAELFAACRAKGLRTALDSGWPPDGRFREEELGPLLHETDLFLPNRAEARAVTGCGTDGTAEAEKRTESGSYIEMEEVARRLGRSVEIAVVKDGERGAWGIRGDAEVVHRPTLKVTPEDTIGAGDAFNAGLIKALLFEGRPMGESLDYANAAARLAITSTSQLERYPADDEIGAEQRRVHEGWRQLG